MLSSSSTTITFLPASTATLNLRHGLIPDTGLMFRGA
jgi:hypothetical protein